MINEHEHDEFTRSLFKSLPDKELSASFVADTMKRIEREARKVKARTRAAIVVGSIAAVAAVVASFALWPDNLFVRYAESLSSSVRQAFTFEGISLPAPSGFGITVGVTTMTLLSADLFFETRRKRKNAERLKRS